VAAGGERSLQELLAELSARSPAPGGGSATAWAGAIAAALTEMVASFADQKEAAERAGALRARLLEAGERELRSYEPVLQAQRLPASDPARTKRLRAALAEASEALLQIARGSAEVAELAASVAADSKPALQGDAIAGALLAEASSRAAARLVEINLSDHGGDPRLGEVAALAQHAAVAREHALRIAGIRTVAGSGQAPTG
jgi:formiminotetrahydrofolate cyclodeaminase